MLTKAQIQRENLQYLKAERSAKRALAIDPDHEGAKKIAEETRRMTYSVMHEIEYYDFKGREAGPKRFGHGVNLAATLFAGARLSATLLETARYRFDTMNNQVGLALAYRPARFVDFHLRGLVGAPAEVVSRVALLLAVRWEMLKYMDATLSYGFDLLPWPKQEPGHLHRASLDIGVFAHKRARLGSGYTLGLMRYCRRNPVVTHSGHVGVKWIGDVISIRGAYSYGEEHDPVSAGVLMPTTCEEIAAVERASLDAFGFDLAGVRIHTGGVQFTWQFTRTVTLLWGYRTELRTSDRHDLVIPAHIVNLGALVWF